MRGRIFLALSVVLGTLGSCDFQQEFGDSAHAEYGEMGLTVTACADDALTRTVGSLWKSGDELKMRLSGADYEDAGYISLQTAAGGTSEVTFTGVMPSYRDRDNAYLYFSSDGEFDGTGYTKTISSVQTGLLEDAVDNILYYSWARWDSMNRISEGNALKSVAIQTQMAPMAALLKINIPAQLQARNVKVKASSPIAGTVSVNPQKGWGSVGETEMLYIQGESDEIVIGDGNVVSGDVYVVVMPDGFDAVSDAYCNAAQTVTLSCDYYEGDYAKRYSLNDCMACGTVTDLGILPMPAPKIPVEGGKIRLMQDAVLTIGIADANPDCEYYYELGDSEETCVVPTVNSVKFDPATGFSPKITGASDRYFIKVLAHPLDTDYKGVVMTASLRHWKFDQNCPTAAVYRDAANLLATNPSSVNTTDGLIVRRRAAAALNYTETAGQIEFNNCIVPFMSVEQQSDVYIYMLTSNKSNISTQRTINLFYIQNGSASIRRASELNGNETITKILRQETAAKVSVVWNLGTLDKGDELAFAPDSKTTYYAQGILEVL